MRAAAGAVGLATLALGAVSLQLRADETEMRRRLARSGECYEWYGSSPQKAPASLEAADLRRLPDKGLSQALLKYGWDMKGSDASMPRALRLLLAVHELDGEVNNGGFIQYFWNTDGRRSLEALEGFRLIGAQSRASLLERALEIRAAEIEKTRPLTREGSLEAFTKMYKVSALAALDEQYYNDDNCIWELVTRKVRRDPAMFALSLK